MVYLVGAGPGDPALITVKGLNLIKTCDTLIYDRLGTTGLLEQVRPDCRMIYVGKEMGSHTKTQAEINDILVREGSGGRMVVRLKGGDPFVFGRGGEEAMALAAAGVPYLLVPGVTSAVAVPEACGIPVTHRGESRSFHVYTGHLGRDADDLSYIQKNEGTSIFLMSMSRIDQIVKRLLDVGYDAHTHAAVISQGTLPRQMCVRGSLSDICDKAAELPTPAVIVIGANASLSLNSPDAGALSGAQIGLVGTAKLQEKMRAAVEAMGGQAYGIVSMEVRPIREQKEVLRQKLRQIRDYSWIAFTSQNMITLFFDWLREWHVDHRLLAHVQFAVVGEGTRKQLRMHGYEADYMPETFTTAALAEGLAQCMTDGQRLLLPRAKDGTRELTEILDRSGISYDEILVYEVTGRRMESMRYLSELDAVMMVSASGVRGCFDILTEEEQQILSGVKIAALGKVTEQALLAYGRQADIVPEVYDIEHLVCAVADAYDHQRTEQNNK